MACIILAPRSSHNNKQYSSLVRVTTAACGRAQVPGCPTPPSPTSPRPPSGGPACRGRGCSPRPRWSPGCPAPGSSPRWVWWSCCWWAGWATARCSPQCPEPGPRTRTSHRRHYRDSNLMRNLICNITQNTINKPSSTEY